MMNSDGANSSSTMNSEANRSIGSHIESHIRARSIKKSSKEYTLLMLCNNREASIADLHRDNSANSRSSGSRERHQ